MMMVQNFLLFYSLKIIHRRISITPRAENEGDSASTMTPAASAAPKLVPSNAASIKVNECIRLEKFCFFCFLDQNRFFFCLSSLSWGRSRLSLSSLLHNSRTTKVRRRHFLCRQHNIRAFLCACHVCIRL